ncbi:MAG TPA: PEP-CTERM sorting domain-containing protein, partial [Vicinamibacterales bacterium]
TSIQFSGLGLSVLSDVDANATSGFNAGELANLDGFFGFRNITHPADVVVDNVSYSAWLTGGGSFVTTPFVAPPTGPGITFVDFTTAFVFTGSVQGYATSDHTGPPLFDFDLTGTGTASAHVLATDDQYVTRFGVGYEFGASPTPEPSSLLLLVTSLGGLALLAGREKWF